MRWLTNGCCRPSRPKRRLDRRILVEQTPLNLGFIGDLLAVIPRDAARIVEVGCSGGGLAREYRKINPRCEYIGLEINPAYAEVAREHCTRVVVGDIERLPADAFGSIAEGSSWIFGDVLGCSNALVGVRAFANAIGADPEEAVLNATPLQYVVRALPV